MTNILIKEEHPNGVIKLILNDCANKNALSENMLTSLVDAIKDISNHDKTIKQCSNILKKYFSKKKKLKFIMVSGIFSEKHSDAIQIINF